MKNIFKTIVLFFVLVTIGSCTNDKDPVVNANGFELRKDANVVSPLVLTEATATDTYAKFNWDRSNNGTPSVSTYTLVFSDHDADPNFLNAVESQVGLNLIPDAREAILTVEQFNVIINQLPTFNCGAMNIDVRIKSKLGVSSNALYQYSNPITLNVTGYSKKPLIMAFVKEGENPANGNRIVSSSYTSASDYEGFMYLTAGDYKFYQPDPCGSFSGASVFGISGGNSGTLIQDGTTSYNVPTDGHYFIKVNATAGTYTISPFNTSAGTNVLGIFGNATKTIAFQNTTPMTYDVQTKKWKVTISLIDGKKFSFKTGNTSPVAAVLTGSSSAVLNVNNAVTVSTATVDNTGTIKAPGSYVNDNTKTKYDISLDLNTPRQYSYTIELNPN